MIHNVYFQHFCKLKMPIYAHSSTGLAHFMVITKKQRSIKNEGKRVEHLVRLEGHKIPGIVNSDC